MKKIENLSTPGSPLIRINIKVKSPFAWSDAEYVKSKLYKRAVSAAKFYAYESDVDYWNRRGLFHVPDNKRYEKLYRRVLPIFQKYLP